MLDSWDPRSQSDEYRDRLKILEEKIGDISIEPDPAGLSTDATLAVEVYQTATQVYLARASQSPLETPTNLDYLVDMAFDGPIQTCACPHFFPLFILACEARTDDRRTAILNLIDRNETTNGRLRSKEWLRNIIQSVWVHQDLHADSELLVNYAGVMSTVISSSNTVPSFV